MFSHVMIGTNNIEESSTFWEMIGFGYKDYNSCIIGELKNINQKENPTLVTAIKKDCRDRFKTNSSGRDDNIFLENKMQLSLSCKDLGSAEILVNLKRSYTYDKYKLFYGSESNDFIPEERGKEISITDKHMIFSFQSKGFDRFRILRNGYPLFDAYFYNTQKSEKWNLRCSLNDV